MAKKYGLRAPVRAKNMTEENVDMSTRIIYKGACKRWRDEYDSNDVCMLEEDAADLNKVAPWMCSNFGAPISDMSTIHRGQPLHLPL